MPTNKQQTTFVTVTTKLTVTIAAAICFHGSIIADSGNAASCSAISSPVYTVCDTVIPCEFGFINRGDIHPTSIDVTATVGDSRKSYHATLDGTTAKGRKGTFSLPLATPGTPGEYPLTLRIDKVNGIDNDAADMERNGTVVVLDHFIKRTSLLEEYTGTWCSMCPIGYVALEATRRDIPQEAVCIAYHTDDPMHAVNSLALPETTNSYPTISINRSSHVLSSAPHSAILEANKTPAKAGISVTAEWDNSDHTSLTACATVDFAAYSDPETYAVEFTLIQDGMTKDTWYQSNSYSSGAYNGSEDPLWDLFVGQGTVIFGLAFNDIAIANTLFEGREATTGAGIPGQTERFVHTFSALDNLRGAQKTGMTETGGDLLVQNPANTRVAAIIIDKATGTVVNASECNIVDSGQAGTSLPASPSGESYDSDTELYSIDGIRADKKRPSPGIYIRRQGNTAVKIIVK